MSIYHKRLAKNLALLDTNRIRDESGLKIPRPQGCAGSTPAVRTSRRPENGYGRTIRTHEHRIHVPPPHHPPSADQRGARRAGAAQRARGRRQALRDRRHAGARQSGRSERPRRPDRAPVRARRPGADPRSGRERRPDRRRRDEPDSWPGASLSRPGADQARRGLRGLLPVLLSPRTGGSGSGRIDCRRARSGARLRQRPSGRLGSHPHRRRSTHPVAAPDRRGDPGARANPACEDAPLAYAPAHRRAGACNQNNGPRACRRRQDDGRRCARQPSPRTHGSGARGLPHAFSARGRCW